MEPFFTPCGIDCPAAPASLFRPDRIAELRGRIGAAADGSPDPARVQPRPGTFQRPVRAWFSGAFRRPRRKNPTGQLSRAAAG